MHQKIPFYGMSFSHGTLQSKKKIQENIRYTNPNALRKSDRGYIPIHSFGTLGTTTYYSTTIVCFNILANVYGTEFLSIVSNSLLKYGDNYMKRYKVTCKSTQVEKAVGYLFLVNLEEIQTIPQNRFYTFYKNDQQPYDYTLYTSLNNETAFANIPFPTVELKKEGKKYYTITDFIVDYSMSASQFQEILLKIKNADGSNMYSNTSFIGSLEVNMREHANPEPYMSWNTYDYDFGICKMKNIFSVLTMGLYGSEMKYKEDDHFQCLDFLNGEYSFSDVIQYFANYNENNTFECKGIFTFHCKEPDFNIIEEDAVFSTEEHQKEGWLSLTPSQISQQRKRKQYSHMKRKAQKAVTKYVGK